MDNDLISRAAVKEAVRNSIRGGATALVRVFKEIDKFPTVDAAPVPHGYIQDSDVGPICSVCGVPIRLDHETPDWCPRCGAALDGGDEDAR